MFGSYTTSEFTILWETKTNASMRRSFESYFTWVIVQLYFSPLFAENPVYEDINDTFNTVCEKEGKQCLVEYLILFNHILQNDIFPPNNCNWEYLFHYIKAEIERSQV